MLSLILGGIIGASQGYFIAYSKIPAFIVTLAGMLIFRGLTGNMLQGQFVGPFAKGFQSDQRRLYPGLQRTSGSSRRRPDNRSSSGCPCSSG